MELLCPIKKYRKSKSFHNLAREANQKYFKFTLKVLLQMTMNQTMSHQLDKK